MIRQPERLKLVANQLADFFVTETGTHVFSLIKALSDQPSEKPEAGGSSGPKVAEALPTDRVGIWEPKLRKQGLCYLRSNVVGEPSSFWARTACIPPKGTKRRVVLLGESVARGYFYDPYFTPASVLQHMLVTVCRTDNIEVVDLARTNLLLQPLMELARSALVLKPDVFVVFAGNNWTEAAFVSEQLPELAVSLRRGGWRSVKAYLEGQLRDRVRSCLEFFASITRDQGIPVVFVLPEFNLLDWRTDHRSPPLLSPESTSEWLALRSDAECALRGDHFESAKSLGLRISELDGGTTPCGANILAEANHRMGAVTEAREFFEMARDSAICLPRRQTPRCFSVIQETIRAAGAVNSIDVVDLPIHFQRYLSGALPDRRLFLDYCHLTAEGIRVAMASVSAAILPHLKYPGYAPQVLLQIPFERNSKIEGEAHFLAAIHNAHWGQGSDIVRYHCQKAFEHSPQVSATIAYFLDFQLRKTPSCLCQSFEEMCQLDNLSILSALFHRETPLEEKILSQVLVQELTAVLGAHDPEKGRAAEQILFQEHSVSQKEINLLQHAYAVDSWAVPPDSDRFGYYRALEPVSRFRLICEDCLPVQLNLIYRIKNAELNQEIFVMLNGVHVQTLPAPSRWHTATIALPADILSKGFNLVEIRWPLCSWSLPSWIESVATKLAMNRPWRADIDIVYGEIHSLRATPVKVKSSQTFAERAQPLSQGHEETRVVAV